MQPVGPEARSPRPLSMVCGVITAVYPNPQCSLRWVLLAEGGANDSEAAAMGEAFA